MRYSTTAYRRHTTRRLKKSTNLTSLSLAGQKWVVRTFAVGWTRKVLQCQQQTEKYVEKRLKSIISNQFKSLTVDVTMPQGKVIANQWLERSREKFHSFFQKNDVWIFLKKNFYFGLDKKKINIPRIFDRWWRESKKKKGKEDKCLSVRLSPGELIMYKAAMGSTPPEDADGLGPAVVLFLG